jgi:glycosyltransferase involved in cell wall biosynthesis
MSGTQRRALVLAYFFPPLGGGGVQRTLKHVKYLPAHGYEAIVVTTRLGWSPTPDESLATEVPANTVVLRAPEVPVQFFRWGLDGLLRRLRLPQTPAHYIGWPDEMVGWAPGAILQALRAVRQHRPDVLYSTSSPVSAHLVALAVNRITGLPWVADFRDGWTLNPQGNRLRGRLHDLSERLERAIGRRASFVVVVDESVEVLGVPSDDPRLVLIRNGVDPDDVPVGTSYQPSDKLRISYVGALYGERNAAPVVHAMRSIIDRGVVSAHEIELRLVGHRAPDTDASLEGIPLSRSGYVDHAAALAEMAAADVLLFYAPAVNRGPSGKIYEYLVAGRPILCVAGRDNFASQLVGQLGAGPCVEPDDQPGIERAIEDLHQRWKQGRLTIDDAVRTAVLRRFSRQELARQLAGVLDAAARGDAPSEPH